MTSAATDSKPANTGGTTYGAPRPVGGLLAPILRPAFRKRAPATAQLLADWDTIMGPAIAAISVANAPTDVKTAAMAAQFHPPLACMFWDCAKTRWKVTC